MLCALSSCQRHRKTPLTTLVIGVENEIKSLDFRQGIDANSAQVMRLFAEGLVDLNEDLELRPEFARSFESSGARVYRFRLPTDRKFHSGRPATCEDVRASFVQTATKASGIKAGLADVASFECPQPDLFVMTLKGPRPSFLAADVPPIRVYPRDLIDNANTDFWKEIDGSGPFRFVRKTGRDLVFDRDPQHPSKPFWEHVVVRTVADPTTRYLSLVGGDIDVLVNALSPRRLLEAMKNPKLRVYRSTGVAFQYLGFNLRSPKFRDVRVRRALALALDRDSIIEKKLLGFAKPANSVLPPTNPFYAADLGTMAYDPVEAKRLLKAAGAEHLEIELKSSSDADVLSILRLIQESWQKIGVRVVLRPFEFPTFFSDIQKGNFEMFSLRWTGMTEADLLNKLFHSREFPPGRNRTFYANPKVDDLLDRSASEINPARRKALVGEVQHIIFQDLPYIPLWYPDNVAVATKDLSGYKLHPSGLWTPLLRARKDSSNP